MGSKNHSSSFKKISSILLSALFYFFSISSAMAMNRVINLEVGYKTVYFAKKPRKAIAVNQQVPAPTLHFKEGDKVTINVSNHLDKGTAIHWMACWFHGKWMVWRGSLRRKSPLAVRFNTNLL